MSLVVNTQPIGKKLHRLEIFSDGQFIGEYERSQEADIERKKEEIKCALSRLVAIHRSKGEFVVRWDGGRRVKSIRVNGIEVDQIPIECWRRPSWEVGR